MSLRRRLKKTGLPPEIQKLIRRVVRRTKLRWYERADVANELIVHFEDAIEEGVEPSQAITDYGNIKTAAKLIRKAKKRQRWLIERAFVRACKWTSLSLACLILVYAALVVFALGRKPNIVIDYVAMLNQTAAAVPEEDRAWPLYREAGIVLRDNPIPESDPFSRLSEEFATQDNPLLEKYATWVETQRATLDLVRKGAAMKGMGYVVVEDIADDDAELFSDYVEYKYDGYGSDTGMLAFVTLPQIGTIFDMTSALQIEANIAAVVDNQEQLCFEDIKAMLQLGVHVRETPFPVCDMVAISIFNRTFGTLVNVLEHDPEFFTIAHLQALRDQIHMLDPEFVIRSDGARMKMLDFAQRMYTDNGHGDGAIIPEVLFELTALVDAYPGDEVKGEAVPTGSAFLTPLGDFVLASRKELIEEFDRRVEASEVSSSMYLYEFPGWESSRQHIPLIYNKYYFLDVLFENGFRYGLTEKYAQARRDGVLAVLYAVEQYQMTGQWPLDLTGANVFDAWSGDSLKIAEVDGLPVIYSIGADQHDDGGLITHENALMWRKHPASRQVGDWVFFSLKE